MKSKSNFTNIKQLTNTERNKRKERKKERKKVLMCI
jgi:hypothetical protein